jgi:polygalacturonase
VNKLAPIHIKQGPAVVMGPALIEAGDEPGIIIENVGDIVIKDVVVRGNGTNNKNHGIRIENSSNATLNNMLLENVEVVGFGEDGILVCSGAKHGFKNVKINNCISHNNGRSGITVRPADKDYPATPHSDVLISHCIARENTGIPGLSEHSGSGIFISGFRRGLIQYCEAYENGALCDATQSGPVGIWAYNCDGGFCTRLRWL